MTNKKAKKSKIWTFEILKVFLKPRFFRTSIHSEPHNKLSVKCLLLKYTYSTSPCEDCQNHSNTTVILIIRLSLRPQKSSTHSYPTTSWQQQEKIR